MGLKLQLERAAGVEVVGEGSDGSQALELIRMLQPDVAVLDLRMPGLDGIEVAVRASTVSSATRVVIFSSAAEPHVVQRALDAGVVGYVHKESPIEQVITAVRAAAVGGRYVDPNLVAALLGLTGDRLSERELEVLQLAADGNQNRGIAQKLHLSEETVKSHISNVIRKLGANSRTEAVASALRRSLIR